MAEAVLGIVGNQVVARYKLRVGRRINSATPKAAKLRSVASCQGRDE
jgi:divalent metal cation (Fe/Co/Zn/Cd) transporter